MAPQLSGKELDYIQRLHSDRTLSPIETHSKLNAGRRRCRRQPADVTTVRRSLKGITHRRGVPERRGRKCIFSRGQVHKMNRVRKKLLKNAKNEREVRWEDVRKRARVPKATRKTLKKSFAREGLPVSARAPRRKPVRTAEQAREECSLEHDPQSECLLSNPRPERAHPGLLCTVACLVDGQP